MRRRNPDRLQTIADAALALFTERGYRLTQVADVAAAAGVSSGTIYNYAVSKEALLQLAVLQALDRLDGVSVPLPPVDLAGVIAGIDATLTPETTGWPVLHRATLDATLPWRETLAAVVEECFAFLSRRYRFIWLLDRLSLEIDDIRRIHVLGAKTRYLTELTRFLSLHRPEEPAVVAAVARGVLEVVVWFAMHRHRDRLFPDLDDETALRLARDLVLDGAAGQPARPAGDGLTTA